MLTFQTPSIRSIAIFALAMGVAGSGGVAGAQDRGTRRHGEPAAVSPGAVNGASMWGGRLKLSESGLARSQAPSREEEGYIVIRDGRGRAGSLADRGHRMTAGSWGLWAEDQEQFAADGAPAPGWDRGNALIGSGQPPAEDTFGGMITYYTPRFEGLRFEGTYASRFMREESLDPEARRSTYLGGVTLGANLDRALDQFGIGVAIGYFVAETPDDDANPDMAAWNIGFRIDFEGLRFDGAYKKQDEPRGDDPGTLNSVFGAAWHIGARYRWGANGISLSYSRSENEPIVALPGEDEKDAARLSYARDLGPGVKWSVNGIWADRSGPSTDGADGSDGMALGTSIRLSF